MGKRHLTAAFVFGLFFAAFPGVAAEAVSPTEQVKETIDQALAVVEDSKTDESAKLELLRKIISPRINFQEMTRRVLARHWQKNASRESEFTPLFKQLLEVTYMKRVWLKEGRGIKVVFARERQEDNSTVVMTKLTTAKGLEIPMDYRLHSVNGEWKIYDIHIEGVSMVANYRAQFDRKLREQSFDELLTYMKKRVSE